MFANGAVNVAEIFLAKASFDAGDFGFGLLWAATGVGLVVGGLAGVGSSIAAHGVRSVYIAALAVFAVGTSPRRRCAERLDRAPSRWSSPASGTAPRSS